MAFPIAGEAAIITKADNTTALNLGGSWTGGVVPGATDIATWDSTVTSANTTALGGSISLAGINITNPTGNVVISNTSGAILSLGSSGISVASGSRTLSIADNIALTADQTWNYGGAGQNIVITGATTATPSSIDLGSNTLTVTGTGAGGTSFANLLGNISGSGSLVINGNSNLTASGFGGFVAINATSYTGSTTINGGMLLLRTNTNASTSATLAGSSQLTINGGTLWFDTSASVNSAVPISVYGGYSESVSNDQPSGFIIRMASAPASSITNATVGDTTLRSGAATIAWYSGSNHGLVLNSLTRDSSLGGVLVFGSVVSTFSTYLNNTGLAANQKVTVTNGAPTPIGGTLGTTSAGVVPWAIGFNNATPITYDSNGFRLLTSSEYVTSFASAASGDNVRLTSGDTLTSSWSVNSLGLAATSGTLTFGSNALTVTSGLVYSQATNAVSNNFILGTNASSTTDTLDFGSQEAIFYGNVDVNAMVTGTGGLTVGNVVNQSTAANDGLILRNSNNTFTGGIRIQKGALKTATNSEVIADSNNVFIAENGSFQVITGVKETVAGLSGTGTARTANSGASIILGSTIVSPTANAIILNTGGVLAPGNESGGSDVLPGQLTLATNGSTGSILLQGGAVNLSLNSATAYDSLSLLATTVSLNGATTLNVSLAYAPTVGDGFLIVANDGSDAITGLFSNGSLVSGSYNSTTYYFDILYNTSLYGGTGNDIALVASAVPEPSTIALLGLAALVVITFRLRHRKNPKQDIAS